jgi:hypothetical protein
LRAVIDPRQHDQRGLGRHGEGDRQQQRHRGGWADAGQDADERAEQGADEAEQQVGRRDRHLQAEQEMAEQIHHDAPSSGIGTPSP